MANLSSELASATVLADGAFEMLLDAATVLQDAGDLEGHQELSALADTISKAVEKLRQRKLELDAANPANPANENDQTV
jgi:hypothetical protein